MPKHRPQFPHARPRRLARCAGALLLAAGTAGALAQPEIQPGAQPDGRLRPPGQAQVDPLDVMGRTFSGVALPVAPVAGRIEFIANRTRVWIEDEGTGRVQRLLLEGDVRATLGSQRFEASRAVVWIQRLPGAPGDAPTHQVFVYFDGVGSQAADAGTAIKARRLSVDGVVMHADPVRLETDLATEGRPADAFVREGERELARYLRELVAGRPVAIEDVELPTETAPGAPAGRYPPPETVSPLLYRAPVVADAGTELFASDGIISFDPGQIAIVQGESGRSLMLTEGVRVLYQDTKSSRRLQMSAERAVVFLAPGTVADLAQFKPTEIEGLYLEGDVTVTDGEYTLRGPRIYYDVPRDRALIVDAVFWTYDREMGMPLYVRADSLRQESVRDFVAEKARLSKTRFATPHMSIGADTLTVSRYTRSNGTVGNRIDAEGVTLRAGETPFFYWPRWVGDPQQIPITRLGLESSSRTGTVFRTGWDVYTLLGIERPESVDVDLLLDYYTERGIATGVDASWQTADLKGGVFGYLIFDDNGTDVTAPGRRIDVMGETRSLFMAENRWQISPLWSLTAEGAYVSDPRLIDALFDEIAEEGRELTTRARLERTDDSSQFAFEAKTNLMDFVPNQYLLESRGYSVDKLPELSYVRTSDDLSSEWSPGLLTLNSEYRLGQLVMNFSDPDVRDLGFTNRQKAQAAFGVNPSQSVADRLRAEGLREEGVYRLDTRHEVSAVLDDGPVRVNPFVVGRFSAYDTDFSGYSPDEGDNARAWGAAGVRFSTRLQRVDNTVDSRLLDLHRMRHIIEPGVTIWHGGSNVDKVDLPVFDDAVESLNEGTMVRVGVDQTWQTKRGGPGRWRDVDVFRLRAEYVWSSGDSDRESPIGRWFEDRPELSNPGEFIDVEALWQVSDPVGVTGRMVYDVEDTHQPEYTTVGVLIDHSPSLRSSLGERYVNALDSTLLYYSLGYELTEKYSADFSFNYDTKIDDFERFSFALTRLFPNFTMGVSYSFNNIRDESSIGFILSPRGLGGGFGIRTSGQSDLGG